MLQLLELLKYAPAILSFLHGVLVLGQDIDVAFHNHLVMKTNAKPLPVPAATPLSSDDLKAIDGIINSKAFQDIKAGK